VDFFVFHFNIYFPKYFHIIFFSCVSVHLGFPLDFKWRPISIYLLYISFVVSGNELFMNMFQYCPILKLSPVLVVILNPWWGLKHILWKRTLMCSFTKPKCVWHFLIIRTHFWSLYSY
jgi:hypothetical protein